jgi:hypothetical protein
MNNVVVSSTTQDGTCEAMCDDASLVGYEAAQSEFFPAIELSMQCRDKVAINTQHFTSRANGLIIIAHQVNLMTRRDERAR